MVYTRKWGALTVELGASTFKKQSLTNTYRQNGEKKKRGELFLSGETEVEVGRDEAVAFIYGRD